MSAQDEFVEAPKADLHVHLNGSIPTAVVEQFLPQDDLAESADYRVLEPVNGLSEYFRPWLVFDRLPTSRARLEALVIAAVGAFATDGVRYAEIRNSVFYISRLNGISIATALDWLLHAFEVASHRSGVDARLVVTLRRHEVQASTVSELLPALRLRAADHRLVGVDLAGHETARVDREPVERFFQTCRHDLGLGVAIHAGEATGAESIIWAVKSCGAMRIGHALAAGANEEVCELLRSRDVCVEVCLTSNVRSGVVRSLGEHPVAGLMTRGVPFVLCSDNPAVHGRPLSGEYRAFANTFGSSGLDAMYERQMRYAFREAA